jgi:hypothetical protein
MSCVAHSVASKRQTMGMGRKQFSATAWRIFEFKFSYSDMLSIVKSILEPLLHAKVHRQSTLFLYKHRNAVEKLIYKRVV